MVNKNTIEGTVRETAGKAKAAVGKAVGNPSLQTRGKAEEVAGKAQKAVGKATTKAKSVTN